MKAATTARFTGSAEQRKARYRLVALALLAFIGLPAFRLELGWVSILYGALLVGYSLWALRLTVLFYDDDSVGLLLTLLDVAATLPLLLWGSPWWVVFALGAAWAVDLVSSITIQRRVRRARQALASRSLKDPLTGFATKVHFAESLQRTVRDAVDDGDSLCLITLTVQRFHEMESYYGVDAAGTSLVAVCRRVLRQLGDSVEAFRLADDTVAFVVSGCSNLESTELALAASRSANDRLVSGRRVDSTVGYAIAPRDGVTPAALLAAARAASFIAHPLRSAGGGAIAATARSQVAVG
jgi:GGDEF domain-containing protein